MAVEIKGTVSSGRLSSLIQQGGLLKGVFGESTEEPQVDGETSPVTENAEITPPEVGEVPAEVAAAETPDVTTEALETKPAEETPPAPAEEPEPEVSDNVQKRFDKLTAQKYEALEKAERAEKDLAEAKKQLADLQGAAPVRVEDPQDPLAGIYKHEDLRAMESQLERMEEWCIQNPEGGHFPLKNGQTEFVTAEQVRSWHADSSKLLRKGVPERRNYLAQHAQVVQEVSKQYPDMYKAGTEMNKFVIESVKAMPQITKFWDWPQVMAWTYEGMKAQAARKMVSGAAAKKAVAKVATAAKPAPTVTKPASASVGRVSSSQKAISDTASKYVERGGTKNLAALLRAGGLV
jgi:hypothetical protein